MLLKFCAEILLHANLKSQGKLSGFETLIFLQVRQHEEGLQGSWNSGVVKKVRRLQRFVEYNEILNEKINTKLVESI